MSTARREVLQLASYCGWGNLLGLLAPLAGARRPGRAPFDTLARLAGASWPVGRRP
jgi:hypothetical protein